MLKEFARPLKIWFIHLFLKRKVQSLRAKGKMVKVVIGAGPTDYEGWLITNLPVLDALDPSSWRNIFPPASIDRILAEHVIEHWSEDEFRSFLRIVRLFLSKQGFIRIAVPDGFHPDPAYVSYVKPGGDGGGAQDHKTLYNYNVMAQILSGAQYEYNFLEYFDEKGQIHRSPWQISDGFVHRSVDHDPRNKEHPLSYTSLIVDTWPSNR